MKKSLKIALFITVSLPAIALASDISTDTSSNAYTLDQNLSDTYKLKETENQSQKASITKENEETKVDENAPQIVRKEIPNGYVEKLVTKDNQVLAEKKVINNEITERVLYEYYPTGSISRKIISTGVNESFYAENYYPNGKKSSSATYINENNKLGIEKIYDNNGVLRQEIPWVEIKEKTNNNNPRTSKRFGQINTYYPNGKIAATFSVGKEGKNVFFDTNGKIVKEIEKAEIVKFVEELTSEDCKDVIVELSLEELVDLYEDEGDISYNKCGLPYRENFIYEVTTQKGRSNIKYSYDEKGMLRRITKYTNGQKNGSTQKFDSSGNLTADILYKNGLKDGFANGYFPTKETAFRKKYENGKVVDSLTCYFPTGEVAATIPYVNGLKDGVAVISSPNRTEITFKQGNIVNKEEKAPRKQASLLNALAKEDQKCLKIDSKKEELLLDIEAQSNAIVNSMNITPIKECEDPASFKLENNKYVCYKDGKLRAQYSPIFKKGRYSSITYNNDKQKKQYTVYYNDHKRQGLSTEYDGKKIIKEITYDKGNVVEYNRSYYPNGVVKEFFANLVEDNQKVINSYDEKSNLTFSLSYDNNEREQAFLSREDQNKNVYVRFYEDKLDNIREVNKENPLSFIEYNLNLNEYAVYKDGTLVKVGKICDDEKSNLTLENNPTIPPVIKAEDAPLVEGLEELEKEIEAIKEETKKLEETPKEELKVENAILPNKEDIKTQELASLNIGPVAKPDITNLTDVVAKETVKLPENKKETEEASKTEKIYYPNGNLRKTIKTKGSRTEEVKEYSKTGLLLTDTIYNQDDIIIEKYFGTGEIRRKTNKDYSDNAVMAFISRIDFYNTGTPRYEINRTKDTLLFSDKEYYPDNILKKESSQTAPLVLTTTEYTKEGKPQTKTKTLGANVLVEEYNEDSSLKSFSLNGEIMPDNLKDKRDDLLKDNAKTYGEGGALVSEFKQTQNSNVLNEYWPSGKLKTEIVFYNNGEISVKSFDKNNNLEKFAYLAPDGKLHLQKPEVRTIPSYRERYWVDYNNPNWIENNEKYSITSIVRLNLDTAAYILAELEIEVPEMLKKIYDYYK